MKKIIMALLLLVVVLLFAGCTEALVDSHMVITSKDGAGIKTINVRIPRDHTEAESNQQTGDVNSAFFPKGHKPVAEFIQSQLPEGFIVTFEEQKDHWVYSITYNFTDINDYNDKTKALIPEDVYQFDIGSPATLTSKKTGNDYEVTFTEKAAVLNASILHLIAKLHYQEDIFDSTQNGRTPRMAGEHIQLDTINVTIGNDVKSVKASASMITATGTLKGSGSSTPPAMPSPTDWPSPSPWPSLSPVDTGWKKLDVDKGDYTIAVLPDIQNITDYYPEILYSMTEWLAENKEEENIKFVVQVGDLTNSDRPLQWHRVKKAFNKIYGVIPYALVAGNHDYKGSMDVRDSNSYFSTFPQSEYDKMGTFKGVFEEGKPDNSYHTFKAGEHDYLLVTLEFGPRDEVLEWANQIISSHPDHRVIIATHCYLNHDAKRVGKKTTFTPYSYPIANKPNETVNDGEDIWDKVASQHENVFMVLSGHIPHPDIEYRIDEGVHGNKVIQVLVDPQSFTHGGNGLMLLLRFSEDGNTIGFEYYSPFVDKHYKEENQYTIDYLNAPLSDPYTPDPADPEEPVTPDGPGQDNPVFNTRFTEEALTDISEFNADLIWHGKGNFSDNLIDAYPGTDKKGISFNGVDEYIRVKNSDILNPKNGNFTIAFWALLDLDREGSGDTAWDLAVAKRDTGSKGFYVGANRNHGKDADHAGWKFMLGDVYGNRVDTPYVSAPLGEWVFVTAVLDRYENLMKISVDGGKTWALATPPPGEINVSADLGIGFDIGMNNFWMNGKIEGLRIYNKALSDSEVQSLRKYYDDLAAAIAAVEEAEKGQTNELVQAAQALVDLLAGYPEKDELQERIDAIKIPGEEPAPGGSDKEEPTPNGSDKEDPTPDDEPEVPGNGSPKTGDAGVIINISFALAMMILIILLSGKRRHKDA